MRQPSPAAAPAALPHDTEDSPHSDMHQCVLQLEQRLAALGEALRVHQADAVETESAALQRALIQAIERLRGGARAGRMPAALRQRLALASAQVVAQREALARASAALDRAIDVLLPSTTPRGAYSAAGLSQRPQRGGMLQA